MRSDLVAPGGRVLAAGGLALALGLGAAGAAAAGELVVRFVDRKGEPVEHAVAVAEGAAAAGAGPRRRVMDQVDKTYVPHVLAVEAGTAVDFPNSDDIRHHVYSFSDAKSFELPLYQGTPAEPVLFDTPGVVVLGCNIHDFMRGYIYVADSPYFAVAGEDGVATIAGLPAGGYRLTVWHPQQKGDEPSRAVEVAAAGAVEIEVRLDLKPDLKMRRAPTARRKKY